MPDDDREEAWEKQYHHQREHDIATTSVFPFLGISGILAGAGTTITVLNKAREWHQVYTWGKWTAQTVNNIKNSIFSVTEQIGLTGHDVQEQQPVYNHHHSSTNSSSSDFSGNLVSMVSLVGSSIMLLKLASVLFTSRHGDTQMLELKTKSEKGLAKALSSSRHRDSSEWQTAEYFEQMGRQTPEWLNTLPEGSKIIVAGILAVSMSLWSKVGADVMRAKATAMATDYQYPLEAGIVSDDDSTVASWLFNSSLNLKRQCYELLYLNHDYYTSHNNASYWRPSLYPTAPVRFIANVIIGLFKQMGVLNTGSRDPISMFLTLSELTGYWEILTRLVGLYGWAPTYLATHWVLQGMLETMPTTNIKKQPVANNKKKKVRRPNAK